MAKNPDDYLHIDEIQTILYQSLHPDLWMGVREIYDLVEARAELTDADWKPAADGSSDPRWRRNVRNFLQARKETGTLEWDGAGRYRLGPTSDADHDGSGSTPNGSPGTPPELPQPAGSARRYWWVSHNQTHREELGGGFIWSPKTNANGVRNRFYDNMAEVAPGDIVFSFHGSHIQQIGVATSHAKTSPKPDFGSAGGNWAKEGWFVDVEFSPVLSPFRPKEHMAVIGPLLPPKYSPLRPSGDGLQSVYLAELSEDLAVVLASLAGATYPDPATASEPEPPDETVAAEEAELANIQGRTDIGDVVREQLVKARRGQGIFRTNVRMNEPCCRITRIDDPAHLRASHIKPWKDCSDEEKLDGRNGLLLAPHVDHLFDRGWISFSDTGDILVAGGLDTQVLDAWGVAATLNVGAFTPQQCVFLEHHRQHVFRG